MHIREVFDTQVEWTKVPSPYTSCETYTTNFGSSRVDIDYYTYRRGQQLYVEFSRDGRLDVTGQGMQSQIFGSVFNHMLNTIKHRRPDQVVFSAETGRNNPRSRARLYRRIARMLADQLDYKLRVVSTPAEDAFYLDRADSTDASSLTTGLG